VDDLGPAAAAEQIRARPIHRQLVAALDDWAVIRKQLNAQGWRHRLAVARAADPDRWRNLLRDVLEGMEGEVRNVPEEFFVAASTEDWPATTLVLFARGAHKTVLDRVVLILARAQQRHPDDFWINHTLAMLLAELRPRRLDEEICFLSVAVALQPNSAGAHVNLGVRLKDRGTLDAAIGEYRRALRLDNDNPGVHNNLGVALKEKGLLDEAIAEYQEALRVRKDYAEAHDNLGVALRQKGQLDEAIAAHQRAIALKPRYGGAHANLGIALADKGRLDEAAAACRKAIALWPEFEGGYVNLGLALARRGQVDEAIAAWRKALEVHPDCAEAYENLGIALHGKGQLDEAMALYQKAIKLKPNLYGAHYHLGRVLWAKGLLAEAIGAYRKSTELNPHFAESHCNLGLTLQQVGRFAEGLKELRRGHELGQKRPGWPYPSERWLRQAEQWVRIDERLSAVLEGKAQPKDTADRVHFAQLCVKSRQRHALAVRFFTEAFDAQPALAEDVQAGHRYNAACAAALAGCGQGLDAPPGDQERARLRRRALRWLGADLAAWRRLLEKGPAGVRAAAAKQLRHWRQDPDLIGVRDKGPLARLPAQERLAWHKLWADVADTLAAAGN
jgi:tetratricopeptide (TPR) repeat protein